MQNVKEIYERLYKNWVFHNIVAHPAMEFLKLCGFKNVARYVHDETVPVQEPEDSE